MPETRVHDAPKWLFMMGEIRRNVAVVGGHNDNAHQPNATRSIPLRAQALVLDYCLATIERGCAGQPRASSILGNGLRFRQDLASLTGATACTSDLACWQRGEHSIGAHGSK